MVAEQQVVNTCPATLRRAVPAIGLWFVEEAGIVGVIEHQQPLPSSISQQGFLKCSNIRTLLTLSGNLEPVDDVSYALCKSCGDAGMQPQYPCLRRLFPCQCK